jgi:hypothetical protein
MLKLKLVVVIASDHTQVSTGVRVFDKKSHRAADLLVKSGALGRHSKSAYYLAGQLLDEVDGTWEPIMFPMYRKSPGKSKENILDVPAILSDIL